MSPKPVPLRDRHEGKLSLPWLALLASLRRPPAPKKRRVKKQ